MPPLPVSVMVTFGEPPNVAAATPTVSLVKSGMLPPAMEPTVPLSLTASITLIGVVVVLFAAFVSFVALVVPNTPTVVCAVSVPPTVPGMVTVIGQVNVAAFGRAAAVPVEATQAPVTTVAPAGTPVLATQVALVAVAGPPFVQVIVPFSTAPGDAVTGRPVMATLMSAEVLLTVTVTEAVSQAAGTTAGLVQIW